MPALRIIGLGLMAAIGYGIIHDQVTARICVEYFTIGHVQIWPTESPTLLGLIWGVLATWWVGLALGLVLAAAARIGPLPTLDAADLRRPVIRLLMVMGVCAALAGVIGGVLAVSGGVWLVEPLASDVPAERHVRFLIDLWAHNASYAVGILGGLYLAGWTLWKRRRLRIGERALA